MNSVMDDNRMLTLASNERVPLKAHMRMIFEIRDLKYATPATVSFSSAPAASYVSARARTSASVLLTMRPSQRFSVLCCCAPLAAASFRLLPLPVSSMGMAICCGVGGWG